MPCTRSCFSTSSNIFSLFLYSGRTASKIFLSCSAGVKPDLLSINLSYHEKLVQIAGENSYEFQSFEQRHRFVHTLVQNPLVKFQPGQLAVLRKSLLIQAIHNYFPFRTDNASNIPLLPHSL